MRIRILPQLYKARIVAKLPCRQLVLIVLNRIFLYRAALQTEVNPITRAYARYVVCAVFSFHVHKYAIPVAPLVLAPSRK